MNFHVIEGIKKEVTDYYPIYLRIFIDYINSASNKNIDINELDLIERKKIIFYGVKMINAQRKEINTSKEQAAAFTIASAVKDMMKYITPNEFENIFPITKDYDGDKYCTKDYFYTKNNMKEIGEYTIIGDKIDDFLWDYQNWDINFFLVNLMSSVDGIRRSEGEKGIIEEFFEEKGLPTYTMHEGNKGEKFLINNQTEEVTKVKNPKPRYLNIVKEKSPTPSKDNR